MGRFELNTLGRAARIGFLLRDEVVTFGSDVRQRKHGGFAELALNREIEVFGVRELVVNVVAGEKVHRLVNREVQCLVRRGARYRRGERESLSYRIPGSSNAERFVHQDRYRRGPIEAERCIGHLVKQVQVFD